MGTYAYLDGWCDGTVTPEQVDLLKASLKADDMECIEVDRHGSFYFSGDCGYSFYEYATEAMSKATKMAEVEGQYEFKMEESDGVEVIFFGSELYVKMMDCKHAEDIYKAAKREYESRAAQVTDEDRAQWAIERGEVK